MTDLKEQSSPQDSQPAPDELTAENELICEKLLAWTKLYTAGGSGVAVWRKPATETRRDEEWYTPTFSTWADAGLILEALVKRGCDLDIESTHTDEGVRATVRVYFPLPNSASVRKCECLGTPFQAVRAAALAYIKAVKL